MDRCLFFSAHRSVPGLLVWFAFLMMLIAPSFAQKPIKKPNRAKPPSWKPEDFSGVFFDDPFSQLRGEKPRTSATASATDSSKVLVPPAEDLSNATGKEGGQAVWKNLISSQTIEDLIKESKARLDKVVTTPAKFAGGGLVEARKEFTLIASLMGVISQYPENIRWKNSAAYGHRIFAKTAANCKVGTDAVFKESKQRIQDLQDLLKGGKLDGNEEEKSWSDTADHGPTMKLLEWALRESLAPATSSEKKFNEAQEEVVKYAELVAMFGHILQQEGMNYADEEQYVQFAQAMVLSAGELAKAAKKGDANEARLAVGKIDQSCVKCHESYR